MAPMTRRSSTDIERSRKAKLLFLQKRDLTCAVAAVPKEGIKRRIKRGRKRKVHKQNEQLGEPTDCGSAKRNKVTDNVHDVSDQDPLSGSNSKPNHSSVLRLITDSEQREINSTHTACQPVISLATCAAYKSGEVMNSLVSHPSVHAISETETDSTEPFVFLKLEEDHPIDNEASGSVKIEERQDSSQGKDLMDTSCDQWKFLKKIPFADVKNFVESLESGFRYKTQNSSVKGVLRYYHCRRIKVHVKVQCSRKVMVYIPNTEQDECSVNIKGKHTCSEMTSDSMAKMPLQPNDYSTIDEMLRTGVPKNEIKKLLKSRNGNISNNRLNYAVKKASAEIYGSGTLSLGELEEWAKSCLSVPSNQQTAFVIGYDIDHENGRFRIVYSSQKLLSLLMSFDTVAADCTFKTTLQGYPLMVICVIDNMRHAHPVAFATVTRQEEVDYCYVFATIANRCKGFGIPLVVTTFISDGEIALKKAAISIFGSNVQLVNCFFHVMQNVRKHLKKNSKDFSKEQVEQILKDIGRMQISPTKQHFDLACDLFKAKYLKRTDFLKFFDKYMFDDYFRNWFEAFQPGCPATNNALEAVNRAIKQCHLMKERVPFGVFKTRILTVLETYAGPTRQVKHTREYGIGIERKAFDWLQSDKKCRTLNDQDTAKAYVFLPGQDKKDVSVHDIDVFRNPRYISFEEFSQNIGNIHRVDVSNVDWRVWSCTCYTFFKANSCHHVVVAAVSRDRYKLRSEANTSSLTVKRPPGRPKQISQALIVD